MSIRFVLALVVLPCLAMAQAPADAVPTPQPSVILEPTEATSHRLASEASLPQQGSAAEVTTTPPDDGYARSRRIGLTLLGGAGGAVVTGALTGGGVALFCRRDYCGITAGILGLMGAAAGLPLGAWLTGTYLADGDGNLLAAYAGAVFGLAVTLPLHAIPDLQSETHMVIVGLNVVAPLLGATLFYELTSHASASHARALQVTGVSLMPTATQDSKGELLPAIALSGRFH